MAIKTHEKEQEKETAREVLKRTKELHLKHNKKAVRVHPSDCEFKRELLNQTDKEPKLLTLRAASLLTKKPIDFILKSVESGKIKVVKQTGKTIYFLKSEIIELNDNINSEIISFIDIRRDVNVSFSQLDFKLRYLKVRIIYLGRFKYISIEDYNRVKQQLIDM